MKSSIIRASSLTLALSLIFSLHLCNMVNASSYVDFEKLEYSTPVEFTLPDCTISNTPVFSDVSSSYWGYNSIQEAYCRGWVNGVGSGKYAPEGKVSYAEWMTMLVRIFFADNLGDYSKGNAWYSQSMECAASMGLLENTAIAKTWANSAERAIPRYDMAMTVNNVLRNGCHKVLNRYYTIKSSYSDVNYYGFAEAARQNTYYYVEAIGLCSDLGILTGVGNNKFSPNANMTRAAAAAVLCRIPSAFNSTSENRWENIWDTEEECLRNADNASSGTLKNGSAVTEANVASMLSTVGTGTTYNTDRVYSSNAVLALSQSCYGCGTVAFRISDYIFGDLKWTGYCSDITKAHIGDVLVTYKSNGRISHVQIVATTPTKSNNTYVEFYGYSGNLINASDHGAGDIAYASGSVNVTRKHTIYSRYPNLDSSWTLYQ